ncbi:hypothetical protein C1H46_045321 [Malus baccata]|uniref:Uncharacterized protein n=1 Tax=Malus baccata TaxID=106549 RepID=A0A540K4J0_MALBA|nr:hypothetical protein C1H46_045321 [Malus baccata]
MWELPFRCLHWFSTIELLISELQVPGGRTVEAEFLNTPPFSIPQVVAAVNSSATAIAALPPLNEEGGQRKKGMLKWKGSKKINRIYADWLDDVPLVHQHNLVES